RSKALAPNWPTFAPPQWPNFTPPLTEMAQLLRNSYAFTETNNRRVSKSVANGWFDIYKSYF
ncbi:hypothetical protein ACGYJ8_19430, partial [Sulfitobacter sp. 1A12126]|uniref:hypothetical protein n=1 Tax=Sulfitobacter sp. 1A12126 TaxID=3368591 RepID=UPI003746C179